MNSSDKQHLKVFLFSAGGVLAVFIALAGLNGLLSGVRLRSDFTQEKLFTLAPGTKTILGKLESPVTVRLYASRSNPDFPTFLRAYADRVADLLREYEQASGGKVEVLRIDPQPDSEEEDSARIDSIQPQPLRTGELVYLGLSVSYLDKKTALPALSPERERLLEYDISKAISEVVTDKKPVVGVMSGLPLMGAAPNPMNPMMGGGRPWLIIQELKSLYDVREIEMTAKEIPADVTLLMVAHPAGITKTAEFAIDQFVLRGGKLIAFVDPMSFETTLQQQQNQMAMMMGMQPPQPSDLPTLLPHWGIKYASDKVVADKRFGTQINRGRGPEELSAILTLPREAVASEDPVTGQIDSLLMPMPGGLMIEAKEGIKGEALIKSSTDSKMIEAFRAQMEGASLADSIGIGIEQHNLAVRLTGKFKTAFPDGRPKEEAPEDPANPEEKKPEPPSDAPVLKEAAGETSILLFADSDILADQFAVQVRDFLGQQVLIPFNENFEMVIGAVEQLGGDSALGSIRSRGKLSRPFTVVAEMQTKAEASFQQRIDELEAELSSTSARLSELQVGKDPNQKMILSPEQQREIEQFQETELRVRRELKDVRRQLRRDIDSLQNGLKAMNVAGMPLLVIIAGITIAILRRKNTAAS